MNTIKKGFTLIELLIVIAILGVLAVVVLVAINPVQQLARTRDSGRMSTITQLGHSIEAYMASHNGSYPDDLNELVTSGDLNSVPAEVNQTLDDTTACTGDEDTENGWCYDSDEDSFAVWTHLESDTNINFGNCTGGAYFSYLSNGGKACITCDEPDSDSDAETECEND